MDPTTTESILSFLTTTFANNVVDDSENLSEESNSQNDYNNFASSSAVSAAAALQTGAPSLDDSEYYSNDATIIAQRILNLLRIKEDTKVLQSTLVSLGIFIIVLGILMNTLFNMFTIIRRRYTSNNVIMVSMCTSYLLYLIFYCFKLSVYLKDISKYHIYDTLQEWTYGLFLCQFINGLLLTCKLISRFSILALCVKRIVTLFQAKNEDEDYLNGAKSDDVPSQASSNSFQSKMLNLFIKLFSWPYLLLLIIFIWIVSFLASLPVYLSYKLTEVHNSSIMLCDSVYSFPDESGKYAMSTFNYMIFALVLPSILILMSIGIIFAVQCVYDLSLNEKVKSQTNWLLVVLFLVHVVTTLPTEVYKYNRLSGLKSQAAPEKPDERSAAEVEKTILETISNPLAEARPYYYLQYLYISEFIIMPIILLVFYILSTKKVSNMCTLYIKCFDCHEKEELLNKRQRYNTNEKGSPNDDTKNAANSTSDPAVTKSLLNEQKNYEVDEFNEENVKHISGSGRIKIVRKTSASS